MKYMGILLPETNTVVESEIMQMGSCDDTLSDCLSIHFSRIEVGADYAEDEEGFFSELNSNKDRAANLFRFIPLDVIGFFCTSASLSKLKSNDVDSIESNHGIQVFNSLISSIAACKVYKPEKVLLVSPYSRKTSIALENRLRKSGVPIQSSIFLDLRTDIDKFAVEKTRNLVESNLDGNTDLVLFSCTNFRTLTLISYLESHLNIPVISSNQSLFWIMCDRLGITSVSLQKYGSIFAHSLMRW